MDRPKGFGPNLSGEWDIEVLPGPHMLCIWISCWSFSYYHYAECLLFAEPGRTYQVTYTLLPHPQWGANVHFSVKPWRPVIIDAVGTSEVPIHYSFRLMPSDVTIFSPPSRTEIEHAVMSFRLKYPKLKQTAVNNGQEGQMFLAQNKKKEGVVTTASGLQYVVVKEGDGPKPTTTDRVRVNYRGTLINGTELDSSYSRGKPAVFGVTGVIPGWTEALQLMKVGSKYRLFIPSNLAYGERGAGPRIGPNAALIFEVELLGIEK